VGGIGTPGGGSIADTTSPGGSMVRYCIELCAIEDAFAAKLFSGIVVDLLVTGMDGTDCGGAVCPFGSRGNHVSCGFHDVWYLHS